MIEGQDDKCYKCRNEPDRLLMRLRHTKTTRWRLLYDIPFKPRGKGPGNLINMQGNPWEPPPIKEELVLRCACPL